MGPAWAQDEAGRAVARALAQEGAQLFEQDDLQGALDKFKQAYEKYPSPKLFFNIGQALHGLSRNVEALAAFERFLAEATDASPDFIEQASAQVALLNAKLARVVVESNRVGVEVMVDGEPRGTTPLAKPIVVEPGDHRLTATWEGEGKTVEITASAGQYLRQAVYFAGEKWPLAPVEPAAPPGPKEVPALPAPPAPAPLVTPVPATSVPPKPSRISKRTWYLIGGAAVVAAVTTTLVLVYGRTYPDASLGSRTIGGSP
jgi:hypothetical protein